MGACCVEFRAHGVVTDQDMNRALSSATLRLCLLSIAQPGLILLALRTAKAVIVQGADLFIGSESYEGQLQLTQTSCANPAT